MKYTMKSGILYKGDKQEVLMKIKSSMHNSNKDICSLDDVKVCESSVTMEKESDYPRGDVRAKKYILETKDATPIALAYPQYAQGENPEDVGWPICRMPRVDRAKVKIDQDLFTLVMHNSQNYALIENGKEVMKIMHKGITGGWGIEDDYGFTPEILSGIFIFCRYIEQENEFIIV